MMATARERHRPGELPWGWWLRANGAHFEDEDGRKWTSVRDAFWRGELGLPDTYALREQLEFLLRVLLSVDMAECGENERRFDLFRGNPVFRTFYMCWLGTVGLLQRGSTDDLSPEGRSVLMMLIATRDLEWEDLPIADVMAAVVAAVRDPSDQDREQALQDFERAVGLRRHVFAREAVGQSHAITLTSMANESPARMPVRRVTWSLAFDDQSVRDDLFAWIAARVDHWDHWGRMAYRRGGNAFTQHLLGLIVASRSSQT
ncbi:MULTISPECIES: hypothetical protein [unclassified Sphingomonas]|uniref:hypothetical protein n=1 Tax=unclassified Sphingomonas TaxID=196159 RepID=UPI00285C6E3C|nr:MULTISPECIES: hypothetical protein [unclassified Sphingomonas]MDR6115086.1 hypothetical protein [Sphingomonas sp. SORGH_AS_0789]MDR6151240.1 hypothetical protein [Sphingomonas sp. SORGH_AS_0742]